MVASLVFSKLGPQRNAIIAAFVIMVAFVGGLTQTNPDNRPLAIACTVLSGFCIGFTETVLILFAQVQRDQDMIGLSVGLLGFVRLMFGAVSQAIYLTILSNQLPDKLVAFVSKFATAAGVPTSSLPSVFTGLAALATNPDALASVPGITVEQASAILLGQRYGYAAAFSSVYWACFAFGCVGIIGTIFIKRDVNENLTNFVSKKMEGVRTETGEHVTGGKIALEHIDINSQAEAV